jgi:hypothetical protein
MSSLDALVRIAEVEFATIVTGAQAIEPKRRLFLCDGSLVDVWVLTRIPGRFGFHWERRHLDGSCFRYDNYPDPAWRALATFPHHFHDGSEDRVVTSPFPADIQDGFRAFMTLVASRLAP